jgi:hypothetical protein
MSMGLQYVVRPEDCAEMGFEITRSTADKKYFINPMVSITVSMILKLIIISFSVDQMKIIKRQSYKGIVQGTQARKHYSI